MKYYISIIIPTYNRIDSLIEVLDKLENQNFNDLFEVIVINDGSTDGTNKKIENKSYKFDFKLINQENKKQGIARNNGVKNAKGNLIIFIQDDIFPCKDFLKIHSDFHIKNKDENIVAIGNTKWIEKLKNDKLHKFLDGSGKSIIPSPLFDYKSLKNEEETNFLHFYTNNLSIKKSFFEKELFNENFNSYGWEDIECGFRLYKIGMKIYFLERAIAEHNHLYTFEDFLKREKNVALNFNKLLSIQPEIKQYFKNNLIKKIIFKIFTNKLFLSIFKLVSKNLYWYFSGKYIWLIYNNK